MCIFSLFQPEWHTHTHIRTFIQEVWNSRSLLLPVNAVLNAHAPLPVARMFHFLLLFLLRLSLFFDSSSSSSSSSLFIWVILSFVDSSRLSAARQQQPVEGAIEGEKELGLTYRVYEREGSVSLRAVVHSSRKFPSFSFSLFKWTLASLRISWASSSLATPPTFSWCPIISQKRGNLEDFLSKYFSKRKGLGNFSVTWDSRRANIGRRVQTHPDRWFDRFRLDSLEQDKKRTTRRGKTEDYSSSSSRPLHAEKYADKKVGVGGLDSISCYEIWGINGYPPSAQHAVK